MASSLGAQAQAQGYGDGCIARFHANVGDSYSRSRRSRSIAVVKASTAVSSKPASQISRLQSLLRSKEASAESIIGGFLDRLREKEPDLKSFLHISSSALEEAREIDRRLALGDDPGLLAGIPIAIKDNLCTQGMPSTGGSRILDGYKPPYDATAVKRLKDSGAVLIGKTNMDEFGMGSSTESSSYQVTSNPWDLSRVPGGSSGGSAAAVAAGQCACALGSDTGGSIRQPASFCGVVGLKPTYGRVSRFGLMAYASSLDAVGCLGTSVHDTSILLHVIAGHDPADATSSSKVVPNYLERSMSAEELESSPLAGLKFGIINETMGEGVEPVVAQTVKNAVLHLEKLGAVVQEVSLPNFSLGLPAYYVLAASEASSNLARYDGVRYGPRPVAEELNALYGTSRAQGFGIEVKRRVLMGTYALSAGYYDAFYKRAQQVRTLIQQDFKSALEDCQILLSPVAPSPAFKIGEKVLEPLSMYLGDLMTVNVNLAGLPALSLPCGLIEYGGSKLPVGLQLIGNAFEEEQLLRVGHIFEQTVPT